MSSTPLQVAPFAELSRRHLEDAFHATTLARAAAYAHEGDVHDLEVVETKDDTLRLLAQVQGTDHAPYAVEVDLLRRGRDQVELSSRCSCPVGFLCKHAAAVLYAWRPALLPATVVRAAPRAVGAGSRARATLGGAAAAGEFLRLSPEGGPAVRNAGLQIAVGRGERSGAATDTDPSSLHQPWIDRLRSDALRATIAAGGPAEPGGADAKRRRVLYALLSEPRSAALKVLPRVNFLRQDGGPGRNEPLRNDLVGLIAEAPGYLDAADLHLLRAFAALPGSSRDGFDLRAAPADLLAAVLATGRATLGDDPARLVTLGAPREGKPTWEVATDGSQRFVLAVSPLATIVSAPLPHWLDPLTNAIGPVHSALPDRLVASLLAAPPVRAREAAGVARRLAAALTDAAPGVPVPLPLAIAQRAVRGKGTVCLRLAGAPAATAPSPFRNDHAAVVLASIDIDGVQAPLLPQPFEQLLDHVVINVQPDESQVRKALVELAHYGVRTTSLPELAACARPDELAMSLESSQAIELMLTGVHQWRNAGWRITVEPDFPWQLTDNADIAFEVTEEGAAVDADPPLPPPGPTAARRPRAAPMPPAAGSITVEPVLQFGDQRVPLLPLLQAMLGNPEIVKRIGDPAANQDFRIVSRIDATRVTLLPWLRVRPILETLVELHDRVGTAPPAAAGAAGAAGAGGAQREPTTLQLSRFDTPLIARLASAGVGAWKGAPQIRTLADRLAGFSRVAPVEPPRGLLAQLRQYQREGLAWLQFLRSHGLSGLLADDMGLGKTVQTLAHILLEHEQGRLTDPALIVAPTSLVHNWVAEAQRFTPALRTLKLHGTQRHDTFDQLAHADLVVTSYALLPRDIEHLVKQPFSMVVLDEAQVVKNARTQAAQAVRLLRVGQRIALTGTPIENDLDELWAQFDFLAPGLLGDNRYFVKTWRTPIEKRGDTARAAGLAARVRPFMLRRTKEAVAPELPARTEIERAVELEGAQRELYETVRAAMESRVRAALAAQGLAKSHIVVLDALLKLRQVCCDPRLVDLAAARKIKQSAKFEALFDLLGTLRAEGRHILLFSQFTSMLALIEERLDREKTPYALLTGQTRDRARQVERFQKGEVDLFLLSLKAGGTGLNLTAADTVIHYDPWWNPATEQQATDRAHRIGQDKPVFVYRLIAAGTVEERIRQMQARKAQLAQAMLDDADQALARALTDTDIAALFMPVAPQAP